VQRVGLEVLSKEVNYENPLAGFVDADGSITIVSARIKDKKSGRIRIQYRARLPACNCKKEPIALLQ
jgi:hypothetical protein